MNRIRLAVTFGCGFLFAIGLGLSGMTHPSKVLGFLDIAGAWDPSLLCVMGGALAVNLMLFPRILKRSRPLLDTKFHLPEKQSIDGRLLLGAAMFGVGWGIAGVCPGPAIVSVATGARIPIAFVLSMIAGMMLFALVDPPKRT